MVERAVAWISENRQWVFSGVGVAAVAAVISLVLRARRQGDNQQLKSGPGSQNVQAGRDVNISTNASALREAESVRHFAELPTAMHDLLDAMKADLTERPFVREFFVAPNSEVAISMSQPRFRYNADQHPDLVGKVHILEGHGFLRDVPLGNVAIYRMTEQFVELLLRGGG